MRGTLFSRLAGLSLVTLLVLGLAAEAVNLGGGYSDLKRAADRLQSSQRLIGDAATWSPDRVSEAERLRGEALQLLRSARKRLGNDPAIGVAGVTPMAGDQSRALLDLVDSGIDAALAERDLITVAQTYLAEKDPQAPIGTRLLSLLSSTGPAITDASSHIGAAVGRLKLAAARPLSPVLAREVDKALRQLSDVDGKVTAILGLAKVLPSALGADRPRSYLIGLANPSELRPAGGLTGFLAWVTFDKAVPVKIDVHHDEYFTPLQPCHKLPDALRNTLTFAGGCQDVADAGWDPDFPSTAQLIEQMFREKIGSDVDGYLSIDPYVIADLMRLTGPLNMAPYGTLTADTIFDRLNVIVNVDNDLQAPARIAPAVLNKLFALPIASWPKLITILERDTASRHIQVHLRDPQLQAMVVAGHADGAMLSNGNDDYLMAVDANVAMSKADTLIAKSASLKVEIYPSGLNRHEAVLRYTYPNPATPSKADTLLNIDGKYKDYVRIFVPDTATFTSIRYFVDGKPTSASFYPPGHEGNRTAYGVLFVLPRGHTGEVQFFYSVGLPASSTYRLLVQKQAGITERPTDVELSYPGGISRMHSALAADAEFKASW